MCGSLKVCYREDKRQQWKILASIFVLSMFNAMNFTMVYSFLPQLIKSFGTNEADVGYGVGIIAGVMYVGRGISSLPWGYVADEMGHKKMLILSSVCVTIATFLFGFTKSLEWAIITRMLQGLSMGLVGICKSLLAMYCDGADMSFCMATYVSSFSFGLIIGPVIGGFLSFPHHLYPGVFKDNSLFTKFKILLPIGVLVIGYVISIFLVLVHVPHDHARHKEDGEYIKLDKNKDNDDDDVHDDDDGVGDDGLGYDRINILYKGENANELKCQIISLSKYEDPEESNISNQKNIDIENPSQMKSSNLLCLVSNKKCWSACILSFLLSLVHSGYEEIFPLFAATSINFGGLSFAPPEIGIVLLLVASACIPLQFFVIPKILKRLGRWKVFLAASISIAFLFPWLPANRFLIPRHMIFWCFLLLILVVLRLSTFSAQLTTNLFVNDSVDKDLLGTVNGLSITFSTIGRAIAPLVFGSLFAFTLHQKSNASMFVVFIVLSAISLIMTVFVATFFERSKDV